MSVVKPSSTAVRHRDIGARVRTFRTQKKIRQVDLAKNAGLSWRHLIRIEQGEGGEPKRETLDRLAAALGIDRSALTGEDDDEESDTLSLQAASQGLVSALMAEIRRAAEGANAC